MRSGSVLTDSQTGSCAKLPPLCIYVYTRSSRKKQRGRKTLIGQVVVYFSVNEMFCEISVFGEKMGGVGRGEDMSRQKVLGSSDSFDSGLNRVNL